MYSLKTLNSRNIFQSLKKIKNKNFQIKFFKIQKKFKKASKIKKNLKKPQKFKKNSKKPQKLKKAQKY